MESVIQQIRSNNKPKKAGNISYIQSFFCELVPDWCPTWSYSLKRRDVCHSPYLLNLVIVIPDKNSAIICPRLFYFPCFVFSFRSTSHCVVSLSFH